MPQFKLSKACDRFGAQMGRANAHGVEGAMYKFALQCVHLDVGGYDRGGAYWGLGQPLYRAEEQNVGDVVEHIRADNREHAKAIITKMYPHARFYR